MRMWYPFTAIYIAWIIFLNFLFAHQFFIKILNVDVSPLEALVGILFILRDFAQREIGHRVFFAMLVGALLSYLFASPTVAFASMIAFIFSETVDWAIYTYTQRPLSKRILWSALVSSPVDSILFLYFIDQLHGLDVIFMTISKMLGATVVWWLWKIKENKRQK